MSNKNLKNLASRKIPNSAPTIMMANCKECSVVIESKRGCSSPRSIIELIFDSFAQCIPGEGIYNGKKGIALLL